MGASLEVTRQQAVAYRIAAHNLARMMPGRRLVDVAGAWAVPDVPHGTAGLALAQRVTGLDRSGYERALYGDRTLVASYSVRCAMHVFPVRDLSVFMVGARPDDDDSIAASLLSYSKNIDAAGLTPTAAVELVADVISRAVGDGAPTKGEVSTAITSRLPDALTPYCEGCGAPHVGDGLFRIAVLAGGFCFGRPRGRTITLVRTDNWLGRVRSPSRGESRTELTRRFVRCFGPTRPDLFAAALAITLREARRAWSRVAPELVEVRLEGKRAWMRAADLASLRRPSPAEGIRLLPPNDPFLQLRDRELLAPDVALRKRMWRPAANPGLVLVEGRPVALWRPEVRRRTLVARLEPIARLTKATVREVSAAAAVHAPWRDCNDAEAVVAT